jgi:hypothetical protein
MFPGDPSELGSPGPPVPRGAAYAVDVGAEDSPRGERRRLGARGAELAQGGIHPLHDDFRQRGLGVGVVLPPQRRPRPPPTSARCSRRGPPPGTTGCLHPRIRRGWTRSWPR